MKKLFKVCSLILCVSLLFSMSVSASVAPTLDTTKPNFQINTNTASAGDTVQVSVSIANNTGFWSAKLVVSCDDGLSFVKTNGVPVVSTATAFAQSGEATVSYVAGDLTYYYTGNSLTTNVTGNGTLFTFNIKVDDEAISGDYNVYFSDYSSSNFIDVNAQKVGFTFGDGKIAVNGKTTTARGSDTMPDHDITYTAIDCSPVASLTTGLSTYNQTDITPKGTESIYTPTAVGDYVEYILADVPQGTYNLSIYSRDVSGRGTYEAYVDGTLINTVNFANVSATCMHTNNVGEITVNETKDIVLKLSASTVGKFYIMSFFLDDSSIEEKTVDIYTMDEGSRPSVFGVTRDYPIESGFTTVADNNYLSFKRVTDAYSILYHSVYFKLPDDIYTKYSNIKSISFDVLTDKGKLYCNNNGFERLFFSSYPTETPTTTNSVKIVPNSNEVYSTTAKTYTINFNESMGKCILENSYKYINLINSVEINNGNSCNYLYFDNVKLTYEQTAEVTTNNVSIDGSVVNTLNTGSSYTLPEKDNIIAYKDSQGNYYASGDEVTVSEDLSFETLTLELYTKYYAAMRLKYGEVENHVSGIRFYTNVDTDKVEQMRADGIDVVLGTIIAPHSYFGTKTAEDLKFGVDFGKTHNYTSVEYTGNNWFTNSNVNGNTFTGFVGSIVDIKENHATWDFVARGYAKVTITRADNSTFEKTIYASGDTNLPQRSVGYIANCITNDTDYYNTLSDSAKEMVDFYNTIYEDEINSKDPYLADIF